MWGASIRRVGTLGVGRSSPRLLFPCTRPAPYARVMLGPVGATVRTGSAEEYPLTPLLSSAFSKLGGSNSRLQKVDALTAEETHELIKARFAAFEKIRMSFVIHMLRKVQTKEHMDRAMDIFHFAQYRLVEGNQEMLWELQRAAIRVGEPRRVLELYCNTIKYRLWPSAAHFNRLMEHFVEKTDDPQGALDAYQGMLVREVKPNTYTFALLVRAYARLGNHDQARAIAEECKKVLGLTELPKLVADALAAMEESKEGEGHPSGGQPAAEGEDAAHEAEQISSPSGQEK